MNQEGLRKLRPIRRPTLAAEAAEESVLLDGGSGEPPKPELEDHETRRLLVRGKGEPLERDTEGGALAQTIIGADERTRIHSTEDLPWRMICSLRIHSPLGEMVGTGWLAGPRTVMTAGHCVYHQTQLGGWAERIEIAPGRDDGQTPFGVITSRDFSTVQGWMEDEDPEYDFGVIHLKDPLGDRLGWFSIGSLPAHDLESYRVNISGYPADRGAGRQQWFHANRILHVSDRRIFYDVDTYGGQSGSPVWIYQEGSEEPLVVGVHAYGVGGTPAALKITANSSPRIIPPTANLVRRWVETAG